MNLNNNQKGFTLIEVLLVMMIIGILSTLAVNGYSQYRRVALLDLSADNVVSQIYELRSRSIHGDFGDDKYQDILLKLEDGDMDFDEKEESTSDSFPKCFGFYFEEGENGYVPVVFEQEFLGKKIWNVVSKDWTYLGCGKFDSSKDVTDSFELDGDASIVEVQGVRGSLSDLFVRFLPPNGEIEISLDGGLKFYSSDDFDEIAFVLKYGVSDDDYYKRKILFNLKTAGLSVSRF